jgi:hypothetical protein
LRFCIFSSCAKVSVLITGHVFHFYFILQQTIVKQTHNEKVFYF